MSLVIRAHFDGKVFVPDEPVYLPIGQAVIIRVLDRSQSVRMDDGKPPQDRGQPPEGPQNRPG